MRQTRLAPIFRLSGMILLLSLLLASCSTRSTTIPSTATSTPLLAYTSTLPAQPSQTEAPVQVTPTTPPADTLVPTSTKKPTVPSPTNTPATQPSPTAPLIEPVEPASSLSTAGTPVPASQAPISLNNLNHLAKVAQWGKGSIQRLAFSADGKSLMAAGPLGMAIYAADDFDQPLRWLPFDAPIFFQDMQVSQDGALIRLQWPKSYPESGSQSAVFSLADQKFLLEDAAVDWLPSPGDTAIGYDEISVVSSDQRLRFEGSTGYSVEDFNQQIISEAVFDNQTNEFLFGPKAEAIYVHYEDANQPEGCDLRSFSMCGNAYAPNVMGPYQAAFSPTGRSLAVMYRPPNFGNTNHYSLLRVYSTKDGSLIDTFGSFDQPVQDFAYQPDTDLLSLAFVNGSIQTWDLLRKKLLHQTWNFSPPVMGYAFSGDGRYLLVQYPGSIEVRRASDGAVAGSYAASTFALSPRENLLALGSKNGGIQVEDLDQRKTVSRMAGHTAVIYALAFSPDGQTLTSSSEDCTIRSWDAHTGQFLHYFEKAEVDAIGEGWTKSRIFVYYMDYLPGSNQLVGFGSWGTAASWNTQSGAKQYAVVSQALEYYNGMKTLNPHFPRSFWVVPEESRFYIAETAYDLKSGVAAGSYTPPENLPKDCGPVGPRSADGSILFTPGYGDLAGQVCVLNAKDNRLLYSIPLFPGQSADEASDQQIFLSPDGARLYAASADGSVIVYQVQP